MQLTWLGKPFLFFMKYFLTTSNHNASFDLTIHRPLEPKVAAEFLPQRLMLTRANQGPGQLWLVTSFARDETSPGRCLCGPDSSLTSWFSIRGVYFLYFYLIIAMWVDLGFFFFSRRSANYLRIVIIAFEFFKYTLKWPVNLNIVCRFFSIDNLSEVIL